MEWSENYSTGVPELDAQHRYLFAITTDLERALERDEGEAAYAIFLRSLADHVQLHFGTEEACMRRHACPVWQLNQSAHEMFSAAIRRTEERHAIAGYTPEDAQALLSLVHRWLEHHIARVDVQLRQSVPRLPPS